MFNNIIIWATTYVVLMLIIFLIIHINFILKKKRLEKCIYIFPITINYNDKNINLRIEKEFMKNNFDKYENTLIAKITYFFNDKPAFYMIINNELYDYNAKLSNYKRIIINKNYEVDFDECYKIIKKAEKKFWKEQHKKYGNENKKEKLF